MFIGEAAQRVGLTVKAIRLYERLGLLRPPLRTDSGYRVYADANLERLRLIKWARSLGLRLSDVREFLVLLDSWNGPSRQLHPASVIEKRLDAIAGEIQRLQSFEVRMRTVLASLRRTGTADVRAICSRMCHSESAGTCRRSRLETVDHRIHSSTRPLPHGNANRPSACEPPA